MIGLVCLGYIVRLLKLARQKLELAETLPDFFTEYITHEDETASSSQYVRRYGNTLTDRQLEDFQQASLSLATARAGATKPFPLHVLADVLMSVAPANRDGVLVERRSEVEDAFALSTVWLFPAYLRAVMMKCCSGDETGRTYDGTTITDLQRPYPYAFMHPSNPPPEPRPSSAAPVPETGTSRRGIASSQTDTRTLYT